MGSRIRRFGWNHGDKLGELKRAPSFELRSEIPEIPWSGSPDSVTPVRYVAGMDIETVTIDRIEQKLLHGEAAIARIRAARAGTASRCIKRWVDGGRTDPENLTTVC